MKEIEIPERLLTNFLDRQTGCQFASFQSELSVKPFICTPSEERKIGLRNTNLRKLYITIMPMRHKGNQC